MISVYHKHMDLYGTTDGVEHCLRGLSTYLCQFPGKPATLYHFNELEFEMIGPENDDRSVEERAEENEVIDLRDGAGWEADLPESND